MSFVKIPPRPRYTSSKAFPGGNRPHEKKRKPRPKPGWDSTVTDLDVHKASPDEMIRRKEVATSKNVDLVKAEKMRKQIAKASKMAQSPGRAGPKKRHNAFLREVLHDDSQITEALVQSDKMMAMVKDIFGDNCAKYRGLPNVTSAPGIKSYMESLPDGSHLEGPTKLDVLSDSVMDQSALNDLNDPEYDSCSDEASDPEPVVSYKPGLDMGRFERLLEVAEREEGTRGSSRRHLTQSMAERALQKTLDSITRKETDSDWLTKDIRPMTPEPSTQSQGGAINDTGKVQRTRVCTNQSAGNETAGHNTTSQPGNNTVDLKQCLEDLSSGIHDYERRTGREVTVTPATEATFSGYTATLVNAVSKLTTYLREGEQQLRAEMLLREQLSQDVTHLKTVVDVLTTDIITTQEEHSKIQIEFQQHKRETNAHLHTLRQTLLSRGIDIPPVMPAPRPAFETPAPATYNVPPAQIQNGYHGHISSQDPPQNHPQPVHHPHLAPQQPSYQGGHQSGLYSHQGTPHPTQGPPQPLPYPTQGAPHPTQTTLPRPTIPADYRGQQVHGQPPYPQGRGPLENAQGSMRTAPAQLLSPPKQADSPRTQERKSLERQLRELDQINSQLTGYENVAADQPPTHSSNPASVPHQQRTLPGRTSLQSTMQQIIRQQQQQQKNKTEHLGKTQPMEIPTEDKVQMTEMQRQLAELNLQHAEAQNKLQMMLAHQNASSERDPTITKPQPNHNGHHSTSHPSGSKRVSVSPPISPIPPDSEQSGDIHTVPLGHFSAAETQRTMPSKSITVSIPRMDSDVVTSPQEGHPTHTRQRSTKPNPRHVPFKTSAGGVQPSSAGRPTGWLSLASHVPAS